MKRNLTIIMGVTVGLSLLFIPWILLQGNIWHPESHKWLVTLVSLGGCAIILLTVYIDSKLFKGEN